MKTFFLVAASLLATISSHATQISLLTITSEAQPGKIAYIGVDTDAEDQITGIFYKNVNGKMQDFTLPELAKTQTIFSKTGYTLVSMKVPTFTSNSAALTLNYVQNVFTGDNIYLNFKVNYNAHLHKYEMLDEKQRQITRAHATTHRNRFGISVGIDDFQTQ